MKAKKVKVENKNERDSVNVTPMISIKEPVINLSTKTIWEEIFRFVSVGGDFV